MGLLDKLKNMFTEEDVDEEEKEPIKKEVFQVEIPAPKIEEKKEEKVEPEKVEKQEKFVFPVYFDDSDFKEEEPPKKETPTQSRVNTYSAPTRPIAPDRDRHVQAPKKPEEVKKKFKLSPVISPVYGILDKNYKKEDIIEKKSRNDDYFGYQGDSASRVDKVRKKAFGTLEDELESTLSHIDLTEYAEVEQVVTPKVKEELETEAVSSNNEELEDMFFDKDMTLEEAINKYDSMNEQLEPKKENSKEKDDLIESDLFNLIDSMYDKEIKEDE